MTEDPYGRFTDSARKALELALREALSLGHNYVGPEHLLLGVARQASPVVSGALERMEISEALVRNAVVAELSGVCPRCHGTGKVE